MGKEELLTYGFLYMYDVYFHAYQINLWNLLQSWKYKKDM